MERNKSRRWTKGSLEPDTEKQKGKVKKIKRYKNDSVSGNTVFDYIYHKLHFDSPHSPGLLCFTDVKFGLSGREREKEDRSGF